MTHQRLGSSRTPGLPELLRAAMANNGKDQFVALPGVVRKYDSVTQRADVKPLLERAYTDDTGDDLTDDLPEIPKVPVVFPRAGNFFFSMPVEAGDNVLLLFCDRSIDNYMQSNGSGC
jgi:hypothetical protein